MFASAAALAILPVSQASQATAQAAQTSADSPVGQALEHLPVPMRDGVDLDTSVSVPKGEGPFPVIVVRSPYPISRPDASPTGFDRKLMEKGYALVLQNERGMYMSEGRHEYMANAGPDGWDT